MNNKSKRVGFKRNLVGCNVCGVMVRLDRLEKHILNVHQIGRSAVGQHRSVALAHSKIVHPSDYVHCPQCELRVLNTNLSDHMKMSCPNRGVAPATSPPWSGASYDAHWRPW
jgi:hypothetical protein